MLAVVYLSAFLAAGIGMVRLLMPQKGLTVRIWLGMALGVLLMMELPALFAYALRFSAAAHAAAAAMLPLLLLGCRAISGPIKPCAPVNGEEKRTMAVMAAFLVPMGILSAYLQHTHMIMPAADGSYWCGQSTYGDLCMHLSFITSMRDAAFPPAYNLLADTPMAYPYLADSLSTSMLLLGLDLHHAVTLPGTLLMLLTYAGYMLLARRILGGRNKAVLAAALLFFFNGGLGFLYDFDLAGRDQFARVAEIFTGYYKTPANQPELNLRFSNVIADLMIPQRALLGGWAMVLPALYLLLEAMQTENRRMTVLLALWAGCLPLVHTHTFLALGLFSGGYLAGLLLDKRQNRREILLRAGLYLGIVLIMALPQLLFNAIRQTVEGGSLRLQFNWVNNSGGRGMIDGYFWFWVKNAGLPFLLIICACIAARRRGLLPLMTGMSAVYLVAEIVLFQPNEYDNNKLFYIWYMVAVILAADYGSMIMQRLAGLPGRGFLCALFMAVSMLSGALSVAREAVSGYQLFSASAVEAGEWIRDNTKQDAVFLTGQQHINPVCSLAGRQIICGSDLYVFFHGLDYRVQAEACMDFLQEPRSNMDVLDTYGVDYIYVSDYERSEFDVDTDALRQMFPVVFENRDVCIYAVTP